MVQEVKKVILRLMRFISKAHLLAVFQMRIPDIPQPAFFILIV